MSKKNKISASHILIMHKGSQNSRSELTLEDAKKKIDDINILKFSYLVIILLASSCFFFSKISSVYYLFLAILFMRFSGQGMMSHTATTTISRFFNRSRGKALSTSWFGLSTSEFILPVLIIYFLTIYEWRDIWIVISLIVIFLGIYIFDRKKI